MQASGLSFLRPHDHRITGVNNLIDRSDFTNSGSTYSNGCFLSIQTKVDSTLYPSDTIGSIHFDKSVVWKSISDGLCL